MMASARRPAASTSALISASSSDCWFAGKERPASRAARQLFINSSSRCCWSAPKNLSGPKRGMLFMAGPPSTPFYLHSPKCKAGTAAVNNGSGPRSWFSAVSLLLVGWRDLRIRRRRRLVLGHRRSFLVAVRAVIHPQQCAAQDHGDERDDEQHDVGVITWRGVDFAALSRDCGHSRRSSSSLAASFCERLVRTRKSSRLNANQLILFATLSLTCTGARGLLMSLPTASFGRTSRMRITPTYWPFGSKR